MIVNILLAIISAFLLLREFYPSIIDIREPYKKIIHGFIIGFMLILSFINIYRTERDNKELVTTAENILESTKTINKGLENNLFLVKESDAQIRRLKNVLDNVKDSISSQVSLLGKAVNKSKELVDLELQRQSANSPFIVWDLKRSGVKKDSANNINYITTAFRNKRSRTAENVELFEKYIFYNGINKEYYFVNSKVKNVDKFNTLYDITGMPNDYDFDNSAAYYLNSYPDFNLNHFKSEHDKLLFVYTLKYSDAMTGNHKISKVITLFKSNNKMLFTDTLTVDMTKKIRSLFKRNQLELFLAL